MNINLNEDFELPFEGTPIDSEKQKLSKVQAINAIGSIKDMEIEGDAVVSRIDEDGYLVDLYDPAKEFIFAYMARAYLFKGKTLVQLGDVFSIPCGCGNPETALHAFVVSYITKKMFCFKTICRKCHSYIVSYNQNDPSAFGLSKLAL